MRGPPPGVTQPPHWINSSLTLLHLSCNTDRLHAHLNNCNYCLTIYGSETQLKKLLAHKWEEIGRLRHCGHNFASS